ncbi:MAG: hypothetical protein LBH42_00515, partial [Treponema sp.]|nr:hypothetical protein [Treponema sp.]
AKESNLFSFSGSAIEGLFGGFYYRRGFDPPTVKAIADDVASFASLFKSGDDAKDLPLFLRNVDKSIYQPRAFMDYLASYFHYWANYPEYTYVSARNWEGFKARSGRYKSFQINSVLLSVYAKSLESITQIDDVLLNDSLAAIKMRTTALLGDRLAMLNNFLSADAERMFSAWAALPADPLTAYAALQSLAWDDLKDTYLTVYTPPAAGEVSLSLGWWNSFVLDGLGILAREADAVNMARRMEEMHRYRTWPLASDSLDALSLDTIRELASLLGALGAGFDSDDDPDPAVVLLRHNVFRGTVAKNWAKTIYRIATAIGDVQKPLSWTLFQTPVQVQQRLAGRGRLLAVDRFRYLEASYGNAPPRRYSTFMNEKLALLQGDTGPFSLSFFRTSQDRNPGAAVDNNRPWAVFELYLKETVTDDQGNSYIPLFFEDQADRYTYYTTLEFNREIPERLSWYSSRNWPDLAISGGTISERRRGLLDGAEP